LKWCEIDNILNIYTREELAVMEGQDISQKHAANHKTLGQLTNHSTFHILEEGTSKKSACWIQTGERSVVRM